MSLQSYDVVVVGAGPSGLMAAGAAGAAGARVLLLEKNRRPGRKLLISGGGRCNFTNAEFDTARLVSRYDTAGKALFSPFSKMGPRQVLEFFSSRGMPYKVEDDNRAFPRSDSSESVLEVLLQYIRESRVELQCGSEAQSLNTTDQITISTGDEIFQSRALVLATGGLARPDTGSTGDGFRWLETVGHSIVRPEASLVPIVVEENWITDLQGLAFPDLKISLRQHNKVIERTHGKVLFTHFGLSGPAILNLSSRIAELGREATRNGTPGPEISLNFFPNMDAGALDRLLLDEFAAHPKRMLKTILETLLPPRLARRIILRAEESQRDALEVVASEVPKMLRKGVVSQMQDFRLRYRELQSEDWAVVSSGGVPTNEVDFRTMESKYVPGLYLCGDMLNINRPSGGYSLQICWATGYVAGCSAALATGLSDGQDAAVTPWP